MTMDLHRRRDILRIGAALGWITEGIADYMRYYVLLPDDPGRFFNPQGLS